MSAFQGWARPFLARQANRFDSGPARQFALDETLAQARRMPLRARHVLYEAGAGGEDDVAALLEAALGAPDLAALTHTWSYDIHQAPPAAVRALAAEGRVRLVERGSARHLVELGTAARLVSDGAFGPDLARRPGQVYLHTGPVERGPLGLAAGAPPGGALRNLLAADLVLSSSPAATQRLRTRHGLGPLWPGAVLEEGAPGTDAQGPGDAAKASARRRLVEAGAGVWPNDRLLVLAPVWDGRAPNAPKLASRLEILTGWLAGTPWRVLLVVHPWVAGYLRESPAIAPLLTPRGLSADALLGAADAVATDRADLLGRFAGAAPALVLGPPFSWLGVARGELPDAAGLPGPVLGSAKELADAVLSIGTRHDDDPAVSHAAAAQAWRAAHQPYADGGVAARVLDVAFRGHEAGRRVLRTEGPRPTTVLCAGGALAGLRLPTLAAELAAAGHDVTLAYDPRERNAATVAALPPEVRRLPREGRFVSGHLSGGRGEGPHRRAYDEEWRRCFGLARFDHVVDGTEGGDGDQLWAGVLAHAPGTRPALSVEEAAKLLL